MPDTYAIIQNGVVVNVILWNASAQPDYQPDGLAVKITNVDPKPDMGWNYDPASGEFTNPNQQGQ